MVMKTLTSRFISLCVLVAISVQAFAQEQPSSPETTAAVKDQKVSTTRQRFTPLLIEDSLNTRHLTTTLGAGLASSQDGELLAYAVGASRLAPLPSTKFTSSGLSQYNAIDTSEVWITNLRSGEIQKLGQSNGDSWSPVWSPDGQHLAFFSDRDGFVRLWLWERSTGTVRRVSDVIIRSVFSYQSARWSPNGRQILVMALHPGTPITGYFPGSGTGGQPNTSAFGTSGTGVRVFEWPIAGKAKGEAPKEAQRVIEKFDLTDRFFSDLALVDVTTGQAKRIAQGVFPSNYWFSPQGDLVACLSKKGQEASNPYSSRFDLLVVALNEGESQPVATDIIHNINFSAVSWSPDGKRLCFIDQVGNVSFASVTQSALKRSNKIVASPGVNRAPLWDARGRFVYCAGRDTIWRIDSNDGAVSELARISGKTILDMLSLVNSGHVWSPNNDDRSLIVVTQDDTSRKMGFISVELASGKHSLLFEDEKIIGNFWSITFQIEPSNDGRNIAFTAEDARHPQDIWLADASFRSIQRVTNINPNLEHYVFGKSRIIEWSDLDGRKLRGALLLPPDYEEGKRYPLVVQVYGGTLASRTANFFNIFDLQILATRGYAVLQPDAPFNNKGMPLYDIAQTVLPSVNKAIEMGIADPDRVAVMGLSFGGYSVLALIVQTKRFKAAIVHAGVGDLVSHYGFLRKGGEDFIIGAYETGYVGLGGTPWSAREKYIENSPIFYLDRVETPVLLTHGVDDDGVPISQAEEIFVGLRRLGKTVTLVEYEGEGHGIEKRGATLDRWDRVLKWLEKYLETNALGGKDTSKR